MNILKSYKTSEVSLILDCTIATVKSEIQKGRLKAFKVGAEYRISEQSLEDYMGVIVNGYKTENEIKLEEENAKLREQLEKSHKKLLSITAVITGTEIA